MSSTAGEPKTDWYTDQTVGQFDMRVDMTRMSFYGLQAIGRDDQDFYFEEVFNRFLSVAQAPLNFAVYDRDDNLLFHFVNDPKYHEHMNTVLGDGVIIAPYLFDLFPQLFGGKYKICVFKLDTKGKEPKAWLNAVKVDGKKEEDREFSYLIPNESEFLGRCAWMFFVKKWDGFQTSLAAKAKRSLEHSIKRLSENFRGTQSNRTLSDAAWPYSAQEAKGQLCTHSLTERHLKWHKDLRNLFERPLRHRSSGLEVSTLMMRDAGTSSDGKKLKVPLPNMIVAYRSFTRTSLRSGWTSENHGYPYDTQLLVRGTSGDLRQPIFKFFSRLKELRMHDRDFRKFIGGLDFFGPGNEESFKALLESDSGPPVEGGHRVLYRDVFGSISEDLLTKRYGENSQIAQDMKAIAPSLDERFWQLLEQPDGPERCVEILQSPVGENARSFVDPVYHTGLIHFNSIFELGGLDRVCELLTEPWKPEQKENFLRTNETDLLRIVMLYYLFSEMADWGGSENFDPEKLQAVLVPLKMRGAVFAVTLHAAYKNSKPKREHDFQNVPRWMAINIICSELRRINQELFDKEVLWPFAMRYVEETLEACFASLEGTLNYSNAIRSFNKRMEESQRYFPYALPRLSTDGKNHDKRKLHVQGLSGRTLIALWEVADNPFFLSPQPWTRKGTRTFEPAIKSGIDRGLKAHARNASLVKRSEENGSPNG